MAGVLGAFAGLALLIAVVGIYGVMSYSVARRTHEIGIRMALGAQRSHVLRMVVASGLRMAAAGMAIGLAGALLVTRVLKTFLYGIRARGPDHLLFGLLCDSWRSGISRHLSAGAPRGRTVDPMSALRQE